MWAQAGVLERCGTGLVLRHIFLIEIIVVVLNVVLVFDFERVQILDSLQKGFVLFFDVQKEPLVEICLFLQFQDVFEIVQGVERISHQIAGTEQRGNELPDNGIEVLESLEVDFVGLPDDVSRGDLERGLGVQQFLFIARDQFNVSTFELALEFLFGLHLNPQLRELLLVVLKLLLFLEVVLDVGSDGLELILDLFLVFHGFLKGSDFLLDNFCLFFEGVPEVRYECFVDTVSFVEELQVLGNLAFGRNHFVEGLYVD